MILYDRNYILIVLNNGFIVHIKIDDFYVIPGIIFNIFNLLICSDRYIRGQLINVRVHVTLSVVVQI